MFTFSLFIYFRVCAGIENRRSIFGTRNEYLDGSTGLELEIAVIAVRRTEDIDIEPGIAYATAAHEGGKMWMLQVDGSKLYRFMEIVSYVMDAVDTSSLLVFDKSVELFLQTCSYIRYEEVSPLMEIVDKYNNAVDRINDDRSWNFLKLPKLTVDPLTAGHLWLKRRLLSRPYSVGLQVNFGVSVETFAVANIRRFFEKHTRSVPVVASRAASWANAWLAKFSSTPTAAEEGTLALIILKSLHKIEFFNLDEYKIMSQQDNYVQDISDVKVRIEYKNFIRLLPKVNLRELLSVMPANGVLHRLLCDTEFLLDQARGDEQLAVVIADISRLVERYNSRLVSGPVDDDCFFTPGRTFPPQRHSEHRIAIVIEDREPLPYGMKFSKPGEYHRDLESPEFVKRIQDQYGDVRGGSNLLPFHRFEISNAITKLPELSRVSFHFAGVESSFLEHYVVPLAEDAHFLKSLRHLAGIRSVEFKKKSLIRGTISWKRDTLRVNVRKVATSAKPLKDLIKSYLNSNSREKIRSSFLYISNAALEFDVEKPADISRDPLAFDNVESFVSKFTDALFQRLCDSVDIIEWIDINRQAILEGSDGASYGAAPFDDMKDTLRVLIDLKFNEKDIQKYGGSNKALLKKFDFIKRELDTMQSTCTTL